MRRDADKKQSYLDARPSNLPLHNKLKSPSIQYYKMTSMATIRLASNAKAVPVLGFGTGTALYNQDTVKSVANAIKAGFRFIDSAEVYANEESTGGFCSLFSLR